MMTEDKKKMKKVKGPSEVRRAYIMRLVARCFILLLSIGICIFKPEELDVLRGMNFFKQFSVFHILWVIWMIDMVQQLIPVKSKIALGSQKVFAERFKPIREKINYEALRKYVISTTKSAYKVFVIWVLLLFVLGILYYTEVINAVVLFMICVLFYVCDLICVLIWCPFRLIMRNKCCTTCRIFNWDHLMMFTPMMFVISFFSLSLVIMAFAIWIVWELCIMMYPERFWEKSNAALTCAECTDKLCTQYCQKLRK